MNHKALFSAEIRDCDLINRIEEQPAVTREELLDAQGEWEAEQYEWTEEAIAWEEGMHPDNLYDDDPYNGEMWEDTYDDPADMYVWDSDLHNEF